MRQEGREPQTRRWGKFVNKKCTKENFERGRGTEAEKGVESNRIEQKSVFAPTKPNLVLVQSFFTPTERHKKQIVD
jgi:hypothetical protein